MALYSVKKEQKDDAQGVDVPGGMRADVRARRFLDLGVGWSRNGFALGSATESLPMSQEQLFTAMTDCIYEVIA